ncbi:MAG: hypothetical protein QOI48_115 [Solirubrobacteraceae bacterium]|jgi:hypothetical protein|nr:hypothetical protein [Solirubrobacteraceae bacterium]
MFRPAFICATAVLRPPYARAGSPPGAPTYQRATGPPMTGGPLGRSLATPRAPSLRSGAPSSSAPSRQKQPPAGSLAGQAGRFRSTQPISRHAGVGPSTASLVWEHMFATCTFHLAAAFRRARAWLRAFAFLDDAPVLAPPPRRLARRRADHRRPVPPLRPPARRDLYTSVGYRRANVASAPQWCVTAVAARCSGPPSYHTTDLDDPTVDHHRHHGDRLLRGG